MHSRDVQEIAEELAWARTVYDQLCKEQEQVYKSGKVTHSFDLKIAEQRRYIQDLETKQGSAGRQESDDSAIISQPVYTPAKPPASPDQVDWTQQELTSLRARRECLRENLLLISEREAQYVLDTDIPLNLIKQERRLERQIPELEQKIANLEAQLAQTIA